MNMSNRPNSGSTQPAKDRPANNWKTFFSLVNSAKPSKPMLIAALSFSLVATVVGLFVPLFTKNLVDGFSFDSLSGVQILLLAGVFVAQMLASGLSIFLLNKFGQQILSGLRDILWRKLLYLPLGHYDREETGGLISRVTNDTNVVKQVVSEHMSGFVNGIISIVGSIVILLMMDWQMTMVLLLAVPLTLAIMMPLGRKMHRISRNMQNETASLTSVLTQVLSEVRLVKSSNAEPIEYKRGKSGIAKLFELGVREGKIQAFIAPLMGIVIMMLMVAIIGYGGLRVSNGSITAGELVAFILYLIQIVMPLGQITAFFTQLQKAIGATERMVGILAEVEEDHASGERVPAVDHAIELRNLSFHYDQGEVILNDINFTIPHSRVTALVGPSGSGKTTLFSLLERYYDPQSGHIAYGERDIGQFSLSSWRSQIGYVSQESPLMSGTIRENIVYGLDREVSEEELRSVSRMAYADGFIDELPDGFETEVGERGMKLSGGQRQRIAIARALLRNPRILMLDEATSALDSTSERVVQEALNNLMRGRTTLVIAHRLSTVVDADQIVFLEKGKVTGIGTHEQLVASHDLYREFAEQQLRYPQLAN